MSGFEAFLLGITQGVTEFLPVSSKGHLVIVETLLGIRLESLTFEILVHFATLGAVLLVLRKRIWRLLWERDGTYLAKLALACLPVGVVGLLFEERVTAIFHEPAVTGIGLIFTGCVLYALRFIAGGALLSPTFPGALAIGLAQTLALLPGVSRSGMTIAAALAVGIAGPAAAEFSFLLSIPVILAASALESLHIVNAGGQLDAGGLDPGVLAIAFLAAFGSGILAIRIVFRLLETHRFRYFAYYCVPAGALFLLYLSAR